MIVDLNGLLINVALFMDKIVIVHRRDAKDAEENFLSGAYSLAA